MSFTPTRRPAINRSPAKIVAFLLKTAAFGLPFFLLLTVRAVDVVLFHAALLALCHQWLATNRLHSMAPMRHFILAHFLSFFERSLATVSDAWFVSFVPSLPTSMRALCLPGPTSFGVLAAQGQASSGLA